MACSLFRGASVLGALVALGACAPPTATPTESCSLVPGATAAQCTSLQAMRLPAALPAADGNAHGDELAAAELGKSLFFDARLSANQQVRCATCHKPENVFDDAKPSSTGLVLVDRNSPSLFGAAWHRWQTWDGKADSLWSQPLLAFENPKEMDFTRLELAHRLFTTWRAQYEALFGALPPLDDATRFPPRGKPGDAAFDGMSAADRHAVNEVAANVGKSLEAYVRKLGYGPGRFDRFLDGDATALSDAEQQGLEVYLRAGCDACHAGPALSDDAFHALELLPAPGHPEERARAQALELLASSPFSAAGDFHDGPKGATPPAPTAGDEGAYLTPSLRNVSRTAPYGHNGTLATLNDAVRFHLASPSADPKLGHASLSDAEVAALVTFLEALDAADPPLPWNGWPDR
jgi:cytochrome c peroxidase